MNLLLPGMLVLGVLVIFALGLTATLIDTRRRRRSLESYVDLVAGPKKGGKARKAGDAAAGGWRGALGGWLRPICAAGLSRNWGMQADGLTLILTAAAGGGAAWIMLHTGLQLSRWISFAGVAVLAFALPRALLKHQQSKADDAFTELFPETIDMVIRMLRAGLPITTAVRSVGNEAAQPVAAVFTALADRMAIGIAFEDALITAAERVGLADFRFFAVSISLQRATGGNLAATLDILSDLMRKRRAMRLKAKATTGEVRMSAYVLGAIPFFIIGAMLVMSPDYLRPLIVDPRGKVIIAMAVGSLVVGFAIIRQMMRSVTHAI